ncbi:MAG: hypothetical protein IKX19_10935 [Clostridia bacterium]|nr:hypothetical protein [Clostridia bacterium]
MDFDKIFNEGQIPGTLEEKTILLKRIAIVERRGSVVSALNLAAAYEDDFGCDGVRWLDWARDIGLERAELYHRLAVGRMLLAVRGQKVLFRKMAAMTVDRLLPLTRLFRIGGADSVIGFVSQHPEITEMDREGIRDAVIECICIMEGKPVPEKRDRTPYLTGWEGILDVDSPDVAETAIRNAVTSEKRAQRAKEIGASLLDSWLDFRMSGTSFDKTELADMKELLTAQIEKIEKLMKGANDATASSSNAGNQCGNHTAGRAAEAGSECGNNTGNQCGNHTEFVQTDYHNTRKECGNHTAKRSPGDKSECGNNTGFVQTDCYNTGKECGNHTDAPYDFDAVFGIGSVTDAGICPEDSRGTAALPGESRRDQEGGAETDGSSGGDPGGNPVERVLSDPSEFRAEGDESADIRELPQLETPRQGPSDGGVSDGSGGPVQAGVDRPSRG